MNHDEILACLNSYNHELERMLKKASPENFMAIRLELLIAVHARRKLLGGKHD